MRFLLVAAVSVLGFAGPAPAEEGAGGVYKCTAENGAVTYSTSPCKGAKREYLSREKLEGKLSIIEFPKPEPAAAQPPSPSGNPPGDSAAATVAPPATPVANPKIRTSPIRRKPAQD